MRKAERGLALNNPLLGESSGDWLKCRCDFTLLNGTRGGRGEAGDIMVLWSAYFSASATQLEARATGTLHACEQCRRASQLN